MFKLARLFNLLSVIALSLFCGAFLFIALVVVKFWQAVEPDVFLNWMSDHFFRFPVLMLPLNLVALVLTIAAFGTGWKSSSRFNLGLSAICIFICTLTFPIYFAGANAEFLNRQLALSQIASAIGTWALWHWIRTGLALIALILASFALFQQSPSLEDVS
ncbi:DUF1772 domain-containing protein [Pseudanabaena sp. PCC 6802]|uniref:DUF1772 domain-containing protein n=1 Tax=Pseudanabaena sp. PCC 6802 TaxID=118173 RepID=UPI00034DC803|nr:DUF1772 domain-containing protein [Pseudanabaena sp. PCC 6802]